MNSSFPPDENSRSSMSRDSLDSRDSIEESLADELAGFQKIVNAIRLYGEDHEFAVSQAGSFLESLRPMLNELGALPLEVRHDSLRFEGVPVIADRDQVGIADALYRDGIHTLTLRSGLSAEEFLELLRILGTNLHLPQHREDTLQGLLWAANLPNVAYEPIQKIEEAIEDSEDAARGESFDFGEICRRLFFSGDAGAGAEGAYFVPSDATEEQIRQLPPAPVLSTGEVVSHSDEWQPGEGDPYQAEEAEHQVSRDPESAPGVLPDEGPDGERVEEQLSRMTALEIGASTGGWHELVAYEESMEFLEGQRDRLEIPDVDTRQIGEDVQAETLRGLLDRVAAILLHSALTGEGELAGAVPLLESCLERGAEVGLAERYRRTLEAIAKHLEGDELPVTDRVAAERLLRALTRIELYLEYITHLDPEDRAGASHLDRVLELAGPQTLGRLLDTTAETEEPGTRGLLLDRIVHAARANPGPLTTNLRTLDFPSILVRLQVLARMDSYAAQDQLAALLDHGDGRVRAAVVELLPRQRLTPLLKRVVGMLAGDRDVDVRCAVIRRLEAERLPALGSVLARMVGAESFHKRETREKELALRSLARCGEDDALDPLSKLLRMRVSVGSRKQAETRRLAALALARLGGAKAHNELTRAANAWDPGLNRDAQDALDHRQRAPDD